MPTSHEELAAIARAGLEPEEHTPLAETRNGWVVLQIKELQEPFTQFEQESGDPREVLDSEGQPIYSVMTYGHGFAWDYGKALETWLWIGEARKHAILISPGVPIPASLGEMQFSNLVAQNLHQLIYMFAKFGAVALDKSPICLFPLHGFAQTEEEYWAEDDPFEDIEDGVAIDADSMQARSGVLEFGRFGVHTPQGIQWWDVADEGAPPAYRQEYKAIAEINEGATRRNGKKVRSNAIAQDQLNTWAGRGEDDARSADSQRGLGRETLGATGGMGSQLEGIRKRKDNRPTSKKRRKP